MSLLDTASLVITPNGTKASTLYSVVPSSGAGDMTVTRATTATRVNSAGLIESVASNVPRLDYSNGTCPSILVEPQRTNLLTYSEQFDNVAWGSPSSVIANAIASPDGTTTADNLIGGLYKLIVLSASSNVFSFYAKKKTSSTFDMRIDAPSNFTVTFNLDNGTATSGATMINIGNGWYRCLMPFTNSNIGGTAVMYPNVSNSDFYIWGAQLEAGSYATSYIPTTSASVTRNADVISKTGISSLIGQTEGTVFIDAYFDEATDLNAWFLKENATFDTFVFLQRETSGIIAVGYYGSGALQARIETGTSQPIGRYKIAFGYKNNDFVLYINGTQIGTDTSGSVTGLMDYIDLHWTQTGKNKQNNVALWKTRLTNTQLAQLTTI